MKTAIEILDDLITGRPVAGVEATMARAQIVAALKLGDQLRAGSNDRDTAIEWDVLRKYIGEVTA